MKSILLAAAFLGSLCWAGTNPYNIIPEPVNVTTTSGTTKNLKIIHEQKVAGLGNEGYAMKLTPGGAPILLKDCYNFDPRNGRDKNDVKHIKGINLCMWAEWIPSGELLMYMTYPRAMAVSETAWGSHKNRPSLEEFEKKMETHKKHFQKRFGYTLERTVENKPYREKFITQEEIERINENYKKGQQNADK